LKGLRVFSAFYLSYLLVVIYSVMCLQTKIYRRNFSWEIFFSSLVIALLFFLAFYVGYKAGSRFFKLPVLIAFLLLSPSQGMVGVLIVLFVILAIEILGVSLVRISKLFLIAGFLSLALLYLYVGIPLFSSSLRLRLVGPLVVTAYTIVLGLVYLPWDMGKKLPLFGIFVLLFYLSSFKSLVVFILLPLIIFIVEELPFLIVPFFLLLSSFFYPHLAERIGFTFLTFENLVKLSFPLGLFHGKLLMSSNPRWLVAMLFGFVREKVHYTYFFFGQAVADFGVFGTLEALALGYLLRVSEGRRSYFFILSVYIYSLDPGIDSLALLFVLGVLLVEYQNSQLGKYLYSPKSHQ